MKLKPEQLESRLQALIEVKLMSALPGFKAQGLVVQKLADAMKGNLIKDANEDEFAPNVFTLVVHPGQASTWQDPRLLESVIASLMTVGEEAGFHFAAPPTLSITQNPDQDENFLDVIASHQVEPVADTRGMTPAQGVSAESVDTAPENAFLIVDGVKVFPLDHPVVNIGRRMDNQLVIDDPRISRNHAQLRAIKGRYVIFDLNSTGGTYINGQKINQSVLYPGDVISLAGVALVFGQDNPPSRVDLADTSPLSPASTERPTASLNRQTGKFQDDNRK